MIGSSQSTATEEQGTVIAPEVEIRPFSPHGYRPVIQSCPYFPLVCVILSPLLHVGVALHWILSGLADITSNAAHPSVYPRLFFRIPIHTSLALTGISSGLRPSPRIRDPVG